MAEPQQDRELIRKQYLVTPANIAKLNEIAKAKKSSATEVVRLAIDAYNPDEEISQSDLLELVAEQLKTTIAGTIQTREKMEKVISEISKNG